MKAGHAERWEQVCAEGESLPSLQELEASAFHDWDTAIAGAQAVGSVPANDGRRVRRRTQGAIVGGR